MRLTLAIAFVIEIVIAFVIEIVIAFVIQTFDQVNITIASTSQVDPLRLCMYMHRSTLVYIYIYIYISVLIFRSGASDRN